MKKMLKNPWVYFGIGFTFLIIYLVIPDTAGEYDSFAECLTEQNAVMYGTDWCSYCKTQKALFGKSFEKVDYVNCDFNKEECLLEGVTGYPTWKINEETYLNVQPLEKLAALTGCSLSN
tara:strand:+ start:120 stop:476 length:357 start_codon:yes stop_codon:yes gene_type:complete